MSGPVVLAAMARGWNRQPAGTLEGGNRTGVSAALWTSDDPAAGAQAIAAEPDPAQHVVCVEQVRVRASMLLDGRSRFDRWVAPGEVSVVPAGARAEGVRQGRWAMLHLYVPDAFLRRLAEEGGTGEGGLPRQSGPLELVSLPAAPDPVIGRIGQEVLAEMRDGQPLARLRLDALGQDLAIHLLRHHSSLRGTVALAGRGGLTARQLRLVLDAMDSGLDGDVGLGALAALARLSPTHFSRAFKQSVGLPPFAWLQQRRIERAKELLVDPHLPLAEVALAVGFAAQPQFTTAFRRMTGMTPGAWRRERLR